MVRAIVGLGDSLSNGYTENVARVPAMPWAGWVALANGMALERHSAAGYTTAQILDDLAPRVQGDYELGFLTAGTNDIGQRDFRTYTTAGHIEKLVTRLAERAETVVVMGLPPVTRIPSTSLETRVRVDAVNVLLRRAAENAGGVFVPIDDLTGVRVLRGDQTHLTSVGYLEAASRAVTALNARGGTYTDPKTLGLGDPAGRVGFRVLRRFGVDWSIETARQAAKGVRGFGRDYGAVAP